MNGSTAVRPGTTQVNSWEELLDIQQDFDLNWVFRGQAGPWPLKTSLQRACEDFGLPLDKAFELEQKLIREFRRYFHFYSAYAPAPDDTLEWLAMMQHYGSPTRLLDWTYSLYVAAFFALEKPNEAHIIWALNTQWLSRQVLRLLRSLKQGHEVLLQQFVDERETSITPFRDLFMQAEPGSAPFVYVANPFKLNPRLTNQQGLFLCQNDISKSFMESLEIFSQKAVGLPSGPDDDPRDLENVDLSGNLIRIEIDSRLRNEILVRLHRVNINHAVLFSGLEGFARSLWTKVPLLIDVPKDLDTHLRM